MGLDQDSDEQPFAEPEELRGLIALGRERGYLTFEQIATTLEEVEVTKEQIAGLHAHLVEQGVEVLAEEGVDADGGLAAGTPYLDPSIQPCTVCADMPCAAVCPSGALLVPRQGWDGYRLGELRLHAERCITFQGLACSVCAARDRPSSPAPGAVTSTTGSAFRSRSR